MTYYFYFFYNDVILVEFLSISIKNNVALWFVLFSFHYAVVLKITRY